MVPGVIHVKAFRAFKKTCLDFGETQLKSPKDLNENSRELKFMDKDDVKITTPSHVKAFRAFKEICLDFGETQLKSPKDLNENSRELKFMEKVDVKITTPKGLNCFSEWIGKSQFQNLSNRIVAVQVCPESSSG